MLEWRENKVIDQNTAEYERMRQERLEGDVQTKYDAKRAAYASKYQKVRTAEEGSGSGGGGGGYGTGGRSEEL